MSFTLSLILASGHKCYSCTYTYTGDPTITYECVEAPENVTQGQPIIECNQHCTIQRQWDGCKYLVIIITLLLQKEKLNLFC